jgi:hypothetical protein
MSDNQLEIIDKLRSGALAGTTRLKLSCDLTEFPLEILHLADTLEILDLTGNLLSTLPEEITQLTKLKILFLSDNAFTVFPSVLGGCIHLDIIGLKANKINHIDEGAIPPGIRWLIITNNRLTQLHTSLGMCVNLQKLMLAGNQLTALPDTLMHCKKLELLRISANRFEEIPPWLYSMPRLAWLAIAGNPATTSKDQLHPPEISWNELKLEQRLGEGASGVISKAHWLKRAVAVKVFKGEVTSDGFPSDEMNACIAAGQHANLVNLLGKVSDHPQQKQGLVVDLIDSSFRNLGGPPDFETCTRDTFKTGTLFSGIEIIRIAVGIASAAAHLHKQKVMHGDLYAHNILIDQEGNPLLSDFGAASICNSTVMNALERIEVRAFGCLLEDLMNHRGVQEKYSVFWQSLAQLQSDCVQESPMLRPDFTTIHNRIKNMAGIQ